MLFWNSYEYFCVCFLSIYKVSQERNYSSDWNVSRSDVPLPASLLWQNRILLLRLKKHQHKCKRLAWTLLKRGHYVYGVCCRVPGSCQQELNHTVYPAVIDQVSQNCTSTSGGLYCSTPFPHGWLLSLVHQQMGWSAWPMKSPLPMGIQIQTKKVQILVKVWKLILLSTQWISPSLFCGCWQKTGEWDKGLVIMAQQAAWAAC